MVVYPRAGSGSRTATDEGCAFSSSLGAAIRNDPGQPGSRAWTTRRMLPPLPAASLPSNTSDQGPVLELPAQGQLGQACSASSAGACSLVIQCLAMSSVLRMLTSPRGISLSGSLRDRRRHPSRAADRVAEPRARP